MRSITLLRMTTTLPKKEVFIIAMLHFDQGELSRDSQVPFSSLPQIRTHEIVRSAPLRVTGV